MVIDITIIEIDDTTFVQVIDDQIDGCFADGLTALIVFDFILIL